MHKPQAGEYILNEGPYPTDVYDLAGNTAASCMGCLCCPPIHMSNMLHACMNDACKPDLLTMSCKKHSALPLVICIQQLLSQSAFV